MTLTLDMYVERYRGSIKCISININDNDNDSS